MYIDVGLLGPDGKEIDAKFYRRVYADESWWSFRGNGSISNVKPIIFDAARSHWGDVIAIIVVDAEQDAILCEGRVLHRKTILRGDTVLFSEGSITVPSREFLSGIFGCACGLSGEYTNRSL